MAGKLEEDAQGSAFHSWVLLQGGEEEPRSSGHRAGDSIISALHPSKSHHFHSFAIQESEQNTIFQRKKKKKERKICSKLSCVCFLT